MPPLVEVLTFEGCPHGEPAMVLAERVVAESGIVANVCRVDIDSSAAAAEHRFLGSPTIRVDGIDIEPHANERHEYVIACRVYETQAGLKGEPDERWLYDALLAARRSSGTE